MNRKDAESASQGQAPLPGRQFQFFLLFWHLVFLGGLAVSLAYALLRQPGIGAASKAVLTVAVLVQAVLYLKYFAWNIGAEKPLWKWLFYCAVGAAAWVAEITITGVFQWVVWAYIGQTLGALPPLFSIPIGIVLSAIYAAYALGWEFFQHMAPAQFLGVACVLVSFFVTGLFMHKVTQTSIERARLIEDLENARRKLQAARQRDAELAALRERERLARDLHDNLGHVLVTLSVQLEAAQRLYRQDAARASGMIDEMKKLVRSSMDSLRRSLANLRTAGLSGRPLAQALQECCEEAQKRSGIAIEFAAASPGPSDLNPGLSEALWHVVRESLINVEKHSGAKSCRVRFASEAGWVVVSIADDGCGMPSGADDVPGHYGLRGMRERMEELGGSLTVSNIDSGGARVEARAPVEEPADAGANQSC